MIDWCNAQLQLHKRDILLSFEHKRDIHNKNGMKLRPENYSFSQFSATHTCRMEFPHFNLLDELISNPIRRHHGYVASDLGLHSLSTSHKMEPRLK